MMHKLIATELSDRRTPKRKWRLEENESHRLGSAVSKDQFFVDWDVEVAARHAVVRWDGTRLFVDRLPEESVGQPIYYGGRESDSFAMIPGEGFVIGNTAFRLSTGTQEGTGEDGESGKGDISQPQHTQILEFHPTESQVRHLRDLLDEYQKADREKLPAFVEKIERIVQDIIPSAHQVVVLEVTGGDEERGVLKRITRFGGEKAAAPGYVCEELVYEACEGDANRDFWTRYWKGENQEYEGMKWAGCMPILSSQGVEEGYLALYLCGKQARRSPKGIERSAVSDDEQVFLRLVSRILSGAREIGDLRYYHRSMEAFLPKPIRNLIYRKGAKDVFRSDQAEVAVLFCDICGSCKIAELGADKLKESWTKIQRALKEMTGAISEHRGAIGDFQGDAAMGFWGWPKVGPKGRDLKQSVVDACRAADALRERFQKEQDDPGFQGMSCRIGVAAGPAWAGMLGTKDQRKIGVFGPVVNLAARLEGLTKQVKVSILIDEIAARLLEQADKEFARQTRYICNVIPAGMTKAVKIYDLMLPPEAPGALLQTELKQFEKGRDAMEKRDWRRARSLLEPLREHDGAAQFLIDQMDAVLRKHPNEQQQPPANWDGVFVLDKK